MRLGLLGAALSGAALLVPAPARAQEPPPISWQPGQPPPPPLPPPSLLPLVEPPPAAWGLHSGDTMPVRETMVYGEIGWPDLTVGFQRGINDVLDVGARFSIIYGVEYTIPRDRNGVSDTSIGIGITVPVRLRLYRSERVSFQVRAAPGFRFDYLDAEPSGQKPFVAPEIALGADLGVHLSPKSTLTLGVDVPIAIQVTPDPAGFVPFLAGLTYEHRFTDRFGMSFNVRPGVVHGWNRTGSATDVALLSQIGFLGRM